MTTALTTTMDKRYPVKVWITCLVLAALLIEACIMIDTGEVEAIHVVMEVSFFLVLFSMFFSWPVLFVCYYIFKGLVHLKLRPFFIKLAFCLTAIAGMAAICVGLGIGVAQLDRQLIIMGSYAFCIVVASFLYPTHKQAPEPAAAPSDGEEASKEPISNNQERF